jgi:hypothetical protein
VRRTRDGEPDPYAELRDDTEAELLRKLRRALNEQRQRLMDALGDQPQAEPDYAFWQQEEEQLVALMLPILERAAMGAAQAQVEPAKALPLSTLAVIWDDTVIAVAAMDWARRYVGELIKRITDNTRALVREAVSAFIDTPGMTIGDLRRSLEPAFNEVRAQRIAVTETTRAFSEGQNLVREQLRRGGLQLERVWRTSMDERVCPICGALADKRESDGWDGQSGPPAHVNCRCWTVLDL